MIKKLTVKTGNWKSKVSVNADIFDDIYVEACTQAIEDKLKHIDADTDFLVNPVMMCQLETEKSSHVINTYKILINAGHYAKAEVLRSCFKENSDVDLATEPITSSMKY